jgi:hypothetical protein
MMLVRILGFGSNWWARFGREPEDRYRFTRRAAYFNSAGVQCGNKVRRYWIVPGLVRFNGVAGFNPHFPGRSVGKTFECADVKFACGGNRLLIIRRALSSAMPDYYLLVVSGDRCGVFNFDGPDWKSGSVLPIAISCLRQKQEAVLLMRPADWVKSSLGFWQLHIMPSLRGGAPLVLLEERSGC